jgi:hypothetical protein
MLAWGILIGIGTAMYLMPIADALMFYVELQKSKSKIKAEIELSQMMPQREEDYRETNLIGFKPPSDDEDYDYDQVDD